MPLEGTMKKIWTSWRSSLLPAVTVVTVLAGASLALASAPSVRDVVRSARGVVGGGDARDDGSDEGLQLVDVRSGGGTGHRGRGGAEDLESALGVTPGCVAAAEAGQIALDAATGLAHAVAVVEANCGENPQAVGLANALEHLQQNLVHQGAHGSYAGGNGNGQANGAGGSDGQGQAGEHGHVGEPNGGQGAGGGDPGGQATDPHGKSTDPGNGGGGGGGTTLR
jgi:hypothetical protein